MATKAQAKKYIREIILALHQNTSISRGEQLLTVLAVHYAVQFCNEITQ
jgi:hypothetical protein